MKKIVILTITLLAFIETNCQAPYKHILWGNIDTNYNKIIFDNYWEFDTIVTKKNFGYTAEAKERGVIYDFNRTNTKMCFNQKAQEIPTSWLTFENEVLNLTFDVGTESSRWQVIKVTEDRIVFRNWYPKDPQSQSYPYYKYKKGKKIFIFKRVDSFGC